MENLTLYPAGLTSLLGLRDMGANPRLLSDQLVGVIDLFELYCLTRRETLQIAGQLAVANAQDFTDPNAVVPPGEVWFVEHYYVRSDVGAASAINLTPTVRFQGLAIPLGTPQFGSANEFIRPFALRQFLAGPGAVFGYLASTLTAPVTVSGAIVVTRFRV